MTQGPMTRLPRRGLWLAAPALLTGTPLGAQTAFTRPVRLIIPWAPGGTTDILGRIVAEPLGQALGQPVLVENRSGASGNVGSDVVAKAAPDGQTLLFGSMSTHAMNHALMRNMPFDGVADFTPLAMLGFAVNTMVVHPSVPAQTLPELIELIASRLSRLGQAEPALVTRERQRVAVAEAAAKQAERADSLYRWRDDAGNLQITEEPPKGRKYERISRTPQDGIEIQGDRE